VSALAAITGGFMSTTAGAEVRRFSLQEHSRVRAINLRWLLPALFAAAAVLYPALVQAQPELQVSIDVSAPKAFSLTQLQSLPQVEAEVTVRSGTVERWRGTPITEVLKAAGLNLADNLGGGFVSRRVLAARSIDGYVAEVDPRFGRRVPLVVWQGPDGAALAPHRGPLMLVAPDDARGSRGVRQLQSLSVTALP
jgi:DMSO/TMAO reductase YedYZ molybdopterin-dependent catalytic subunit